MISTGKEFNYQLVVEHPQKLWELLILAGVRALPFAADNMETQPMDVTDIPTPSEPAAPAPSPETTAHEKRAKFQGKAYQTGSETQVLGEDPPARVEKTPKEDDSTALPGKAPAPKEKTLDQEENLTESGSGNEARVLTCHLYSKFPYNMFHIYNINIYIYVYILHFVLHFVLVPRPYLHLCGVASAGLP